MSDRRTKDDENGEREQHRTIYPTGLQVRPWELPASEMKVPQKLNEEPEGPTAQGRPLVLGRTEPAGSLPPIPHLLLSTKTLQLDS